MSLTAPEPLAETHDIELFDSGVASLNEWLYRRARANQASGASRTFVTCDNGRVVGYYALASSSVTVAETTGRFRRNMPDPIPVIALGRLAIDVRQQGKGLGRALVRDAALRVIAASESIGIRGMVVHAISEEAKAFYQSQGFSPSPTHPMTLMVSIAELRTNL